jgi:broad specificity phosphatase PhoE
MQTLLLVRHAEPELTGVLLGRLDPPLSEAGVREAQSHLAGLEVRMVYSSPLRRALETAQMIDCGAPLQVLEELAEIDLGDWDGLRWREIERRDPDLARRKLDDWFGVSPPGGEPWPAFAKRVARALERIRLGPFPAAVVAHIAVNAQLAHLVAGLDPAAFTQEYCQTQTYDLDESTPYPGSNQSTDGPADRR